ncbi:D-alanyl-D-alanine carboxypeptidase/D-alanyl-D-alanine-endopeptidase [Actinosynnema sp. NPDC059797]
MLVPFLKLSNNMHAEAIVKTLGRKFHGQGTWSAGIRALESLLPGLGVDPLTMNMFDGSGLSRMNVLSPDLLVGVLRSARTKPWFRSWYDALPVAGRPDRLEGGTLRSRMTGTAAAGNVRAKTGSLTGVTGLSGYVTNADGRELVFSMVFNNFVSGVPRDIEDAIAVRLASDRAGQSQPGVRAGLRAAPGSEADPVRDLECSWTKSC